MAQLTKPIISAPKSSPVVAAPKPVAIIKPQPIKPSVVEAPTKSEAPTPDSPAKRANYNARLKATPAVTQIFGFVRNIDRSARKTLSRALRLPPAPATIEDQRILIQSHLRGVVDSLATIQETLSTLQAAGYDPEKFLSKGGGGGAKKTLLKAGDKVELGTKMQTSYLEFLSEEEMDDLVVHMVTASGKLVVKVASANKVIGSFRHNLVSKK